MGAGVSARVRAAGSATSPANAVGRAGAIDGTLELVLVGLAEDEVELLGNLTEARAEVASAQGARAARRWWRGQALRAAPRLAWHDLVHRPTMLLLGLAGFALWSLLTPLFPLPFGTNNQVYDSAHPVLPTVSHVLWDTAVVGIGYLIAASVVGAVLAARARRARLVPGLVSGALMALVSSGHAFYIVYGPPVCVVSVIGNSRSEECSIGLGAWSTDVVVPVLWQLPTMIVLLPLATALGGLAVVAWSRRHRAQASVRLPADPRPS